MIKMRYLLFGTGDYYNRYKKWFERQEVIALVDNSEEKQYTVIDGIKVLPPQEAIQLEYDVVVILSFYVKQMKQQLVSLGVDQNRIYHFYDLHQLLMPRAAKRAVEYYLNAREIIERRKSAVARILLLSHDLTFGGPAIALFHAAKVLKRQGYMVVFASMLDGPLKEKLIEEDIAVVIDVNLQIRTMKETDWINNFSLIICNTINFHVFLSERDVKTPIVWWLHDAAFFYEGVNRSVIRSIRMDNLRAVSVGPVPAEAVNEYLPDMECGELLYGVADTEKDTILSANRNIIRFITIGFLEDIKGQDILLDSIRGLFDDIRQQCEFYIVGHNNTLFGERVCKESSDIEEIYFTGSVDRWKLHRLLEDADVLICPSRQDSMPTVVAEAMMHSVPCIVSDVTGTASYIQDGVDGFIFPSEDAQALAEKIEWCVANKDKLKPMGKRARKLYERVFSMPVFETNLIHIVKDMLRED